MARNREFDTEKILDKAIDLFWHKGYNGISTQVLIDEFGISKSSMYAAFGDKMGLFIAALEKYQQKMANDTLERLDNCIQVKKEIKFILETIVQQSLNDKNSRGCFVVNTCIELAPHSREIALMLKKHKKKIEAAFAEAIKKGIAKDELSKKINPEAAAITITNAISGIQVDAKYIKDKNYFVDAVNGIMSVLQ